jgi:hypothetical protein
MFVNDQQFCEKSKTKKCSRISAHLPAAATVLRHCVCDGLRVGLWSECFAVNLQFYSHGAQALWVHMRCKRLAQPCAGREFDYTLRPRASCCGCGVACYVCEGL